MFFKKIPHHGIFFFEIITTTTVRKDVAGTEFHRGVWSDGKYFHGVLFLLAGYYPHPASSTTISVFPLIFFFIFEHEK